MDHTKKMVTKNARLFLKYHKKKKSTTFSDVKDLLLLLENGKYILY